MRNPWGHAGEWNGDWSDNWSGWTEEKRWELNIHEDDDGVFLIPLDDYLKSYALTTVAIAIAEGLHVTRQIYQDKKTAYFEMDLDYDQPYFAACVNQNGKRLENHRPPHRADRFQPSPFSIIMINHQTD